MEVYTFPDAGSNGSVSGPCSPPTVMIKERDEGPIIQKRHACPFPVKENLPIGRTPGPVASRHAGPKGPDYRGPGNGIGLE